MNIKMPNVRTDTEFFAFQGGLDKATPALRISNGSAIAALNYEPDAEGGYSRCKGYERFDGRTSPSAAVYTALKCTLTATPALGATVTIGAATGLFVKAVTNGCILTGVAGTIPANTSMTVGGSPVGTTAASILLGGVLTADIEAQYLVDAASVYRALISPPPGDGAILGLCYYGGAMYAFRNAVGNATAAMWKSTTAGWAAVPLFLEVSFSNANSNVNEGDTLTQGGVTALVRRVLVETGSLASGTNTGRLIISGLAGGNFVGGAATSTGSGALSLAGAQVQIVLAAGGTYQFDVYNFYGQLSSQRMYGASGVQRCFEFDGTVYVPLRTGAVVDTPSYIKAHRKYLYVSIGSSLLNSSVGDPTRWVASEGATENPVGDTITGICKMTGEALGVMCRNSSFALTGRSSTDWSLEDIRPDVGAVPRTLVSMSDTYFLDDRGVTSLSAVQEYGNFSDATLSRKVQKLINGIRNKVVCAYASRQKGHFVLLMNDGATITMGVNNRKITGFMEGKLEFVPSCAWSGEDETGVERIFIGSTTGQVYEMDKGSTFDGADIEAFLKLYYFNSKSPRIRKHYRRGVMEMTANLYSAIKVRAEYNYGDIAIEQTQPVEVVMAGAGGIWGFVNWDEFFWDAQDISQPEFSIEGTGVNISLSFYSKTKLDFGHTLQGAILHYTARRLQRGKS